MILQYNITYDIACAVIIPNGLQISRIIFLMMGYASNLKLKLQLQISFFPLSTTICVATRAAWTRAKGPLKHSIHIGSWPVL